MIQGLQKHISLGKVVSACFSGLKAKSFAENHCSEIVATPPPRNLAFALKPIKRTLSARAFLVVWGQQ